MSVSDYMSGRELRERTAFIRTVEAAGFHLSPEEVCACLMVIQGRMAKKMKMEFSKLMQLQAEFVGVTDETSATTE